MKPDNERVRQMFVLTEKFGKYWCEIQNLALEK